MYEWIEIHRFFPFYFSFSFFSADRGGVVVQAKGRGFDIFSIFLDYLISSSLFDNNEDTFCYFNEILF